MTPENRLWLTDGILHAQVRAGGFIPLELVLNGVVIARPVPRPVEGKPGQIEIAHPVPQEALSSGVSVLILRKQGDEAPLAALPLIIGSDADDTVLADIALMRAELELIKSLMRERLRAG